MLPLVNYPTRIAQEPIESLVPFRFRTRPVCEAEFLAHTLGLELAAAAPLSTWHQAPGAVLKRCIECLGKISGGVAAAAAAAAAGLLLSLLSNTKITSSSVSHPSSSFSSVSSSSLLSPFPFAVAAVAFMRGVGGGRSLYFRRIVFGSSDLVTSSPTLRLPSRGAQSQSPTLSPRTHSPAYPCVRWGEGGERGGGTHEQSTRRRCRHAGHADGDPRHGRDYTLCRCRRRVNHADN
mmetsp:Transcript_28717/g.71881  ORF Transcript_28717/g.71881 Transcript_28717/m.71881 type:complete len:235 (-) Transcript_28717:94-798(-)